MTSLVPVEYTEDVFEKMKRFLGSSKIYDVFDYLSIGIEDIEVNTMFIQETYDPFTCYNNRLDEDETDVDCGGSKCLVRCSSKQKCAGDGDCDGSMNCFSGKCLGLSEERIRE